MQKSDFEYLSKIMEGKKIIVNHYDKDTETVKRTLIERLFTFPWRPFVTTKEIPSYSFIVYEDIVLINKALHKLLCTDDE